MGGRSAESCPCLRVRISLCCPGPWFRLALLVHGSSDQLSPGGCLSVSGSSPPEHLYFILPLDGFPFYLPHFIIAPPHRAPPPQPMSPSCLITISRISETHLLAQEC